MQYKHYNTTPIDNIISTIHRNPIDNEIGYRITWYIKESLYHHLVWSIVGRQTRISVEAIIYEM